MSLPVDLLHDSSGDLDLSKGLRLTSDLVTYCGQKFSETFAFFLAEWFLDIRLGLPYFKYVIGQHADFQLLETLFRRAALKTHGVGSVEKILLSMTDRQLSINIIAKTLSGDTIAPALPFIVDII